MVQRIALGGLLAALAVVLNHALALVPNIELTSLTIFLAGWLLGPVMGACVGVAATLAFSLTNPMGAAGPVLLIVQCLAYAVWGSLGGLVARAPSIPNPLLLAFAGLLGTCVFQGLMNGIFAALSGLPWKAVIGPALPFVAAHLVSNTVIFGLLLPALLPRLEAMRRRIEVETSAYSPAPSSLA